MDEGLWGLGWALPKPDVPGPSRNEGMASEKPANEGEILEDEPHGQEESHRDQPLFKPNPEEVAEIVISEGDESDFPSLTAVVLPDFRVGTDWKFLLTNFHWPGCLGRQSFSIGGRHRQMAFCPYCRVINENYETALSHVRKHLDLLFVCGGCYSKSFSNGQALHKHMKSQCRSITAIRDSSRSSQR